MEANNQQTSGARGKARIVAPRPEHEVAYQDLAALIGRHAHAVSKPELLAIAANQVGKLIALQDQATMSAATAMRIVEENIAVGNAQVIAELANAPAVGRG